MVKGTLFSDFADPMELEECDAAFAISLKENDGGIHGQIISLVEEGLEVKAIVKCLADRIIDIAECLCGEDDPYKTIGRLLCFENEVIEKTRIRILEAVDKATNAWEQKKKEE